MNARAVSCALSGAGCSRKRAVSEMAMDSYDEHPEASWASARCPHGLVLRWQGRRATGALRHNPVRASNRRLQTSVLIGRRSATVKQQRKLVPRPGEAAHHRPNRNAECFGVSVASPPFRSRLDCDPRIICAAVSVPTTGRACRARVRCLSGRRFSDRTPRDPIPADAHGLDGWDL